MQKEAGIVDDFSETISASDSTTFFSEANDHYLYQTLDDGINELEPEDRQIIKWRHFDRKTPDEIALLLGINKESASNRIWRCMKRLKKITDEKMKLV